MMHEHGYKHYIDISPFVLQPEHNETVSKLNFVLALVECIIELAQSRSSPLSESVIDQKPTSTFTLDHIAFISESQRRMEQLVLYVRALQLLSSSISLAKEEIKSARLQPSNTVRNSKLYISLPGSSLLIQSEIVSYI